MKLLFFILCIGLSLADTTTIVVQLKNGIDPREFAQEHRLSLLPPDSVGHLPGSNFYAFTLENHRSRAVSESLSNSEHVEWHEIQEKRRRFTRYTSDPLYGSQWHLHANEFSVDVESAWNEGITGRGVVVAIVDDGVQVAHPDLEVDMSISHDFNNNRGNDPSPYTSDGHGTAAAGVCCARRNNGQCGSGVAPQSRLAGIRTIAEAVSDLTESSALSYKRDVVDIYSNSWGPADDATNLSGPGRLVQAIFEENTRVGRNGKGSIYVWAGGNGRDNSDSCNYDGYANSIYTIAVGAIDYYGDQSWYSEGCAALFVVAPSSGSGIGITTTDLTGKNGYDKGNCCNNFGGTSSAAPLVSGSIALMLQVRPDLTWRDVQHVLAKSSIHPEIHKSEPTQRGYIHSAEFGFGRINIPRMLDVAKSWTLVPPQKVDTITCDTNTGCTSTMNIDFIEHITVYVNARTSRRASMEIKLIAPNQRESSLFEAHYSDRNRNVAFTFMSVHHWGDSSRAGQQWIVSVLNPQQRISGNVEIKIFGH